MKTLEDFALNLGATTATTLPGSKVIVRQDLAQMCKEPGCPNYGKAASCPPHVGGPEAMKQDLEVFPHALFFRLDAPTEIVLSSQYVEIMRLVHEIAAGLEQKALELGFAKAQGYAGGSCKRFFCEDQPDCQVVDQGGTCRNPDQARPSMSGFGIDVNALTIEAGWPQLSKGTNSSPQESVMPLYGLVLVA